MRSVRARPALAVASVLVLLTGCSATPEDKNASILGGPITVGVAHDEPGFSTGVLKPAGFDINVMEAIGNGLGKPVTPTLTTAADRAPTLQKRRADIIIHSYSITPARNRAGIDFAGPYMVSTQALLVREDDDRIGTKDDLKKKSVCTVGTTTGAGITIPDANMGTPGTIKETTEGCVKELLDKNTDAFFTDTLILYGYVQAHLGKLKVVLPGVFGENQYYGVGLTRGHGKDCQKLNTVIREYLRKQWKHDFLDNFPVAAKAFPGNDPATGDFESQFKPTDNDMTRLSCKL